MHSVAPCSVSQHKNQAWYYIRFVDGVNYRFGTDLAFVWIRVADGKAASHSCPTSSEISLPRRNLKGVTKWPLAQLIIERDEILTCDPIIGIYQQVFLKLIIAQIEQSPPVPRSEYPFVSKLRVDGGEEISYTLRRRRDLALTQGKESWQQAESLTSSPAGEKAGAMAAGNARIIRYVLFAFFVRHPFLRSNVNLAEYRLGYYDLVFRIIFVNTETSITYKHRLRQMERKKRC